MSFDAIRYDVTDNVAEITLDRPDERNAMNETLTTELTAAFEEAEADDDVRTVFLTGAGESFCSGGDLDEFQELRERRPAELMAEASRDLFKTLARYEKPIVGGVNGDAVGGGCGLAAACHLAYARSDARLGTVELRVGMFPFVILPVLRDRIGDGRALELSLTGDLVSADRASEIGLVTDTVENPVERGRAVAHDVASFSPLPLGLGLHAFYETSDMPTEAAIDAMSAYRSAVYKSRDLNEGASAFVEGRDPEWRGY
jgi:methylglutaconyl-CoA hydratase